MASGFSPATSLNTGTLSPAPELVRSDSAPEDPKANFCHCPPGRGPESPRLLPPLTQASELQPSGPQIHPGSQPRPASGYVPAQSLYYYAAAALSGPTDSGWGSSTLDSLCPCFSTDHLPQPQNLDADPRVPRLSR